MKKVITIMLLFSILCFSSCGSKKEPETVVMDFSGENYQEWSAEEAQKIDSELLSIIQNGSTVVVKAKIEQSWNNETTINHNYHIVTELIQKHGFNTCNELQYWAVMDAGMEVKVISFTLDKTTIDNVAADKIIDIDLYKYANDLWIAPDLQK